jgi:flagella synthesis protein FlgN
VHIDGAADAWKALLQLTREAKEINRLNGMLLNKHLSYTQGALNALRPVPQAGKLYGPSGQTFGSNSSGRVVIG